MKPGNRRPKTKGRQSIPARKMHNSTCALRLSHTATSACFTDFSLLNFRDSYHARSRLLDHLNSDAFDYWSDRPFHFPRSFLHWRGFGLGNPLRLRSLPCLTALG